MSNEFYLKKENFRYEMKENSVDTGNRLAGSPTLQVIQGRVPLLDQKIANRLAQNQIVNEKNQDGGEMWKAFYRHWDLTNTLEKDVRISLWDGKVKADSVEMDEVKSAAHQVTDFMLNKEISSKEDEFMFQQKYILRKYYDLIGACQNYVKKRSWGLQVICHCGEGYRRYELVKKTLARARSEKNKLEHRSNMFFQDFQNEKSGERPLWINVLADCRTSQLDLVKSNIRHVGGNCSDVIEITQGEKKGYIKETTYNHSMQQRCDQYIDRALQSNNVRKMKGFLELLGKYFEDERIQKKFVYVSVFQDKNPQAKKALEILKGMLKSIRLEDVKNEEDNFIMFLTQNDQKIDKLITDFFVYYKRSRNDTLLATYVAKISKNANMTDRNVATYRLAELLGIPDLIPAAKKVKYQDENEKEHHGILLEGAKGMTWEDATGTNLSYENTVYIQLNSLQILDTLTGQVDRNGKNCIMEESATGTISKIKGIDNDLCFGNMSYEDYTYNPDLLLFSNYNVFPIEDENGMMLKLIDKKVYEGVLALDDDLVKYAFADLLTQDEMQYFLKRIHGVQKLFRKIQNKGTVCIYDPNKTKDDEIERARQSQQGISYLTSRFDDRDYFLKLQRRAANRIRNKNQHNT